MKNEYIQLMNLFVGYPDAYGTYDKDQAGASSGIKVEIKSSARTIAGKVTPQLWVDHIEGKRPIGIIPITKDSKCGWACIDYDNYDVDHAQLVEDIQSKNYPFIVCKTKSGGAHIYVFFQSMQPCSDVISTLRYVCADLGLGNAEIFPKQSSVLYNDGDYGSWLNMPYFGDSRQGVKKRGTAMSLKEFVSAATKAQCLLKDITPAKDKHRAKDALFSDGPPCLEFLAKQGFPEGTRNNGLMAIATYAKKKYESNWQDVVADLNNRLMDPPLPHSEVESVIKSYGKKDYMYKCKDQPLCHHCMSSVCISRRYGVGDESNYPTISGISVMDTDPALWFVDVCDHRISFSTEELRTYSNFHKVCMEKLFLVFPMLKQATWIEILQAAMNTVTVISMPDEVGTEGNFMELLSMFCRDKQDANSRDVVRAGRVWLDEENKEGARYWFRLADLDEFLRLKNFNNYSRPKMTTSIKKIGGNNGFFNIKGKGINVWWVPVSAIDNEMEISLPDIHKPSM
jgi:hypothetical protein